MPRLPPARLSHGLCSRRRNPGTARAVASRRPAPAPVPKPAVAELGVVRRLHPSPVNEGNTNLAVSEHKPRRTPSVWDDYRRRSRWLFFVCVTFLPGVSLVPGWLGRLLSIHPPELVVFWTWMAAMAITAHRHATFLCPHCHGQFLPPRRPLARHCMGCGLRILTEPKDDDARNA